METRHSTTQDKSVWDQVPHDDGTRQVAPHTAAPGTRRVTIVGAGFSGTLTAIRLLHFADSPLEVCLIEREEGYRYGGIAFGQAATNWEHMLNIQAGRITLRRERPEDFLEWANEEADRSEWPRKWQYHTFGVACVVPRRIYRQYLAERLRDAVADAHADVALRELTGETIDVRAQGDGYVVKYADAGPLGIVRDLYSDQVILATGHLSPVRAPFYHRVKDSDRFIADQYAPGAQQRFQEIGQDETVFVTGSALSAFDTVVSLVYAGHRGQILLCSRGGHMHGTYPVDHEHDIWRTRRPPFLDAEELTSDVVVEGIKAEYAHLRAEHGVEPGSPLDAVFAERVMKSWEPYVVELVSRMDARDVRMLFDRYKSLIVTNRTSTIREIGGVARSRMRGFNGAPKTVSVLSATIQDMRLVESEDGQKIRVVFADRPDVVVDRVVNCLGNNTDYERADDPLWNGLIHGYRYARPHTKTHRGIEVGAHGQLVAPDGATTHGLFTVGPARQGDETTRRGRLGAFVFSIGTLRNQCFDTAIEVLRRLRSANDGVRVGIPDGVHHSLTRGCDWIATDLLAEKPDVTRLRERLLGFARETAYPNALNYLQAQDRTERQKHRGILDDDLAQFAATVTREFGLTAQMSQRMIFLLDTLVEKHAIYNLCDITKLAGWDSQYADQVRHAPRKSA